MHYHKAKVRISMKDEEPHISVYFILASSFKNTQRRVSGAIFSSNTDFSVGEFAVSVILR